MKTEYFKFSILHFQIKTQKSGSILTEFCDIDDGQVLGTKSSNPQDGDKIFVGRPEDGLAFSAMNFNIDDNGDSSLGNVT